MAKSRYHVRSTSLPSTSHPLTSRVEDEVSKLRSWVASKSFSRKNADLLLFLQDGICALMCLYESVEEMLQLQENQRVLIQHRDHRCVDRVLDGGLRLLDVSGSARDALMEMKECVQNTQSALRRRGKDLELGRQIKCYMITTKKITKLIHTKSRKVEVEYPCSPMDLDEDFIGLATILLEVETITLSVCELILSFLLGSNKHENQSNWVFIEKLVHSRRISCENHTDFEMVLTMLSSFSCHRCPDTRVLHMAQKRLEALEEMIGNFELQIHGMFKSLLQSRVTLLNILNK